MCLTANIRRERAVRKWRQIDLAVRLGVSQRVVSEIEAGTRRVSLGEIIQLCRIFEIPLSELLRGIDPEDRAALGL